MELLSEQQSTLAEQISRRCVSKSAPLLVVGGGISAAQATLAAVRAGYRVVLRSRRPLQTRPFDVDHGWFDMRKADRMRFEFLCLPMNRRRNAVREAQLGGSVPAVYLEELHRLSQASSALTIEVDDQLDSSQVCLDDAGELALVNGEAFSMVVLATGVVTAPSVGDSSSLYHSVEQLANCPTLDGLPRVDSRLRWSPHEDIFVLGANAVLELGPGGANLMGAMRGARIVANELRNIMGQQADRNISPPARPLFSNQYASLGDRVRFDDGCSDELDFLAYQLQLSPQAEVSLRRARGSTTGGLKGKKGVKATPYLKGAPLQGALKGERDAIAHVGAGGDLTIEGYLTSRSRWATYW